MLIFSKLRQQGHVTNVDAGFDERLRRLQAVGHRRDLYQQISGVVILQRTCHRDRLIDTGTVGAVRLNRFAAANCVAQTRITPHQSAPSPASDVL